MQSLYNFVIKPVGERYNNSKKVGDKNLILNTEIFNHQYVNRQGVVLSVPKAFKTEIQVGDVVVLHHNVFRRWHNVRGEEKNSRSYFEDGKYFVAIDQIFMYKRGQEWICPKDYCFVQPIKDKRQLSVETEFPLVGVVKYSNSVVNVGDLVGFDPVSEFEFVIDGQRLYRVLSKYITIKYEYQGDEEEYNPSWAQGC
jgi:hypothetical protein